jgi:hypothetical protein
MSDEQLPDVELNPAGFTPAYEFSDEPSSHLETRPVATWIKFFVWFFLIIFAFSVVGGVAIVFVRPH